MHEERERDIEAARTADLIIYVTDGVLRDFEFDVLRRLASLEKRILVCLNKEDIFSAPDREGLLEQMAAQLQGIVPTQDFVTVRANPRTRTRLHVTSIGEEIEERPSRGPRDGTVPAQSSRARLFISMVLFPSQLLT